MFFFFALDLRDGRDEKSVMIVCSSIDSSKSSEFRRTVSYEGLFYFDIFCDLHKFQERRIDLRCT